ncbi:VOC family protein [Sphingobium sp. EP60837]|uniref:VOC family protein n=1 Tax=Sphingobium sp. EP60837 TaxID=1855519 RepID=UPI0007DDE428|nr:VOC family protein [Sphingobium sp. EP60837]ANI80133.1 hypothetical protein EP837_03751 [Sphingobium sp. EP60837]
MLTAFRNCMLPSLVGKDMQLSYVVPDIDEAMRFWTTQLEVGPFVVIEDAAADRVVVYRGRRTRVKMSLAFAYVAEMQIELISATSSDPSPWTDFLQSGRQGLHHLGFWPEDYDHSVLALEQMGFVRECSIETVDGSVSSNYFSGPPYFGVWVELAPNTPTRNNYFAGIKALSERWDGSRAIRRFKSRDEFLASDDCKS